MYQQASPFGDKRQLVRGERPLIPLFCRLEVFMEGMFFVIGFLLGSLSGVTLMCLVQINHIRKEDHDEQS